MKKKLFPCIFFKKIDKMNKCYSNLNLVINSLEHYFCILHYRRDHSHVIILLECEAMLVRSLKVKRISLGTA